MTQRSSKPDKVFRAGRVSAALWRSESEQDGRTVVTWSTKVQNRYRDRQTGEWKDTDYFFPDDLPRLALVAQQAYECIVLKESEEGTNDAPPAP